MDLVRLVYASTVNKEKCDTSNVVNIVEYAKVRNKNVDITGMLYCNKKYFLQCLEGSREHVNEIYRSILKDDRHDNVQLFAYCEITERMFGEWHMGYVPESSMTESTILKHSTSSNFNPYEMHGESCCALLEDLSHEVPIL